MTQFTRSRAIVAAALAIAMAAALALPAPAQTVQAPKEQRHQAMLQLAQNMRSLRASPGNGALIARLQARYDALSLGMGGDDPAALLDAHVSATGNALASFAPPACGATSSASFGTNAPTAILDVATVTSTINVSGMGSYLWDLDLTTFIQHTFAADLDITLTSPVGTTVTITTDNGGANDDVFNGTLWDDSASVPVTDNVFTNLVTATPLQPEAALARFIGEDPNGTWTITIVDDLGGDVGSLNSATLGVTTLASAPVASVLAFSNQTPTPILDVASVTSTITVAGAGNSLSNLDVLTAIQHTFAADLDITLTSPAGTVVVLTTDNGGANDDVFNGTVWNDSASIPVTDYVFANLTTATPLVPEGAFGRFLGENPNGVWTLTITDDLGGDVGSLNAWTLAMETCGGSGSPFCFGDGVDVSHTTACPCANNGALGHGCANSVNALGALLSASGSPNPDTLVLQGSGMPASVTAIYLQGDALGDMTFGDGVNCAGGVLVRLRAKTNVGGASQFPDATDTVTLSQRGGVTPGTGATRYYTAYYRNAAAGFCPPATYNATNGWIVVW